ncbi:MAG: protease modulator HflC [Clostridia bacterium]|nr:protease modulator HflC [Clostridia bacterium]
MNGNTINLNKKQNMDEAKKAIKFIAWFVVIVVFIIIIISASTFTVNEHERAVVKRLGAITKIFMAEGDTYIEDHPETLQIVGSDLSDVTIVHGKGLQWKLPFIDTVEKYDSWLYTYVSNEEEVHTYEKNRYIVTMYAQWRIANPGLFAIKFTDDKSASKYLDNLIFPEIIQNINNTNSKDFINNKELWNEKMEAARENLNNKILESGIEIVDMQVHRTILPSGNIQSTYDKMVANREKTAQQLRSEGEAYYTKQVASADRIARETIAGAILESEQIMAEGDAEALSIYEQAYSADPEFYGYWRSLKALENALDSNTVLVLDRNHPLWADLLAMATEPEVPQGE